jgi:hypothetical protein
VDEKVAENPTTPRGEPAITVDAAYRQRLARGEEPHVAIEGLNAAILAQKVLLFVEGREKPVEPRWFADHARVAIELVEGRATAVVIRSGRGFEGGPYNWTVSGDGMESDAPQSTLQRRRPGRRPAQNWQEHVLHEIVRAFRRGEPFPTGPKLAQSCADNLGHTPDVSAVNTLIRDVLNG